MSAAIRAGRAYVELFLKDLEFNKALDNAKLKLNAWKASLQSIGVAALGIGTAMVTPFALATKAAGDFAETMSKLRAVFGDQSDGIVGWMDSFTGAVGRGKKETADGLAAFQAFFLGMGMGSKEAAELSKEMVTLAVDFGSFHNVADAEAMQRFISAFSGSSEVLDMFGVNIKAAALDAKLLEMGFSTIANGATELQKVLARQAIIKESMGKQGAVGDAIRTADSFSNTLKRLQAQFMDFAIQIGTAVMPIFQQLMSWFSVGLAAVKKWLEEHQNVAPFLLKVALAISTFGAAAIGLAAVISVVLALSKGFAVLGSALKALHVLFMLPITPLGAAFKALAVAVAIGTAAYSLFAGEVEKTSTAMWEQHQANAKTRSDDELRMQRLQQLAEMQSLSSSEMEEAKSIASLLEGTYGALGISIDSVTGKITGMTGAQQKLNAAMKAQQMQDWQNTIDEARANLDILNRERNSWDTGSWNEVTSSAETVKTERARIAAEAMKERNRMQSAQNRLDALKQADGEGPVDLSAAEVEKRLQAKRKAQAEEKKHAEEMAKGGEEAAKSLAKIEDDKRREALTPLQRDEEDAIRRGEERIALIDTVMAGEGTRPGGPNVGVLEELNAKRDLVHGDVDAEIADLRKKAAEEEAKKAQESRAGQLDDIARKELDLKFAAKAGETEEQATKREHEKRLAMIELERKAAMDNLKEGLDPNLVNQDFDLQKRLAEAEFNARGVSAAEDKVNSAGSFAAAIVSQIGQDSLDKP
jgi:hypothetical protein